MKKYFNVAFVGVIAYCAAMFVSGIFSFLSFIQILSSKIKIPGSGLFIDEELLDIFTQRCVILSIMAVAFLAMIILIAVLRKKFSSRIIIIVSLVLLVAIIVASFIAIYLINDIDGLASVAYEYDYEYGEDYTIEYKYEHEYVYYYDFTVQQMLDSIAKSLFVPFILISVMLIIKEIITLKEIKALEKNKKTLLKTIK